jgi:UDP-glucose 4-epimerase
MYNLMNAKDRGEFTIYGNDYNTPDGTCIRDYVHVMEICNAIELAVEKPANGLENLGHGIGKTVKDMVELYKIVNNVDFTVKYGPRRKGDAAVSVLDNPSTYMKHLYDLKDLLKVSV